MFVTFPGSWWPAGKYCKRYHYLAWLGTRADRFLLLPSRMGRYKLLASSVLCRHSSCEFMCFTITCHYLLLLLKISGRRVFWKILEMSGNLTTVGEMSGNQPKVWEVSGKNCRGKLLVANFTFGATPVFSRLLQAAVYRLFYGFCCLLNHLDHFIYYVSKNNTALACYNFDIRKPILIIFDRYVAKYINSQMTLYFPTSPN